MKITKKDIMYLKWLGLFLGIYVFWTYLWLPMSTTLSTKQVQLQELETRYMVAEQTIPTRNTVKNLEMDAKAKAKLKFEQFFDVLTPAQTEAILVPIIKAHRAKISYFQVSDAQVVVPETTLKLEEQLSYKIKELIDLYNNMTTQDPKLPITQSQLLKTQITYLVDVSFEDYKALLKTIDDMEVTILLSSSEYDFNDKVAEMVFDIYSIEKIDFVQ